MIRVGLCGLILVSLSACDEEDFATPIGDVVDVEHDGEGTELVTFRDVQDNSVNNNGLRWNGLRWNSQVTNGLRWNGLRWNTFELNGVVLTNVEYDTTNGTFMGDDPQQVSVSLEPLDELIVEGDYEDGTATELKISEIEQITGGVHNYQFQRVRFRVLESEPDNWGAWEDACTDGANNPVKAILLKGEWTYPDYSRNTAPEAEDATTWACRGAALAKCVEWGYYPEGTHSSTLLEDHHQTCTRMVRADYCGDGVHHTENGTPIDVEDSLGIQTHETTWGIEAAWGPEGALCINEPRKTYWTRDEASIGCSLPRCDSQTEAYWWSQGALFITRNESSALAVEPPAPSDGGG